MSELASNVACPNGHMSADRGVCSVCGARIPGLPDASRSGKTPAAAPAAMPNSAPTTPAPRRAAAPGATPPPSGLQGSPGPSLAAGAGSGGAVPMAGGNECPNCSSELEADSRFCEVCGYDPTTGSLPAAPVPQPVLLPPAPLPAALTAGPDSPQPASASSVPSAPAGIPGAQGASRLIAVVTADRAYYDSQQAGEVQFPVGAPPRQIELPPGQATIGRQSRTLGTAPAVDLAVPPEDPAVSHTHASLLPGDNGTWTLVDHGSTNGTYLNESIEPLTPNVPREVRPGDRIYVGAWTCITLELRPLP
jgi:hypothetical protein